MCGKWAQPLVINTIVANSCTSLLVLFIFMYLTSHSLFLYLHRAILRSQGTGVDKYDYFIGICTNPNSELVTDESCTVIQLNSTNPAKGTGTCLGKRDGAQLTDTLSKCISPYVCHDLHVCRTPPTPCALQAMDLRRQSGLYRGQWGLSYSNLADCM